MPPSPRFIYGTAWKEERTEALVRAALDAGFRAIDTANQRKHYYEAGVGAAIRPFIESGRRDALYLQSKFTFRAGQDSRLPFDPGAATRDQVRQSFQSSLEHLGVERLDSLVLHGPSTRPGLGREDTQAWRALEEICAEGGAGQIGISNINLAQLESFWELAEIKPSIVQNRCYASRGWDAAIRGFCADRGIVYQGFSLLTANRDLWQHPVVAEIAEKHQVGPAQVLFLTAIALGILPLTGTTNPANMAANLAILDTALSPDEVDAVLAL